MEPHGVSRRTLLKGGGAGLAGLTALRVPSLAHAAVADGGQIVPWLDQPAPNPVPQVIVRQLDWEKLDSRLTRGDQFFVINHYGQPTINARRWRIAVTGLVARPQSLSLAELCDRPRREIEFAMECSGNTGLPFFTGASGTRDGRGRRLPLSLSARASQTGPVKSCSGEPMPGQ